MFLSSLIEKLCTKEENNKAGCTFNFQPQNEKIFCNVFLFAFLIKNEVTVINRNQ